MKVFVSWSGGKDSSLSCYEAGLQNYEIVSLLNMEIENAELSMGHGISSDLLRAQARAIDIPLVQQRCRWDDYEKQFRHIVSKLMQEGVEAGVFGDIGYLDDHGDWVQRVCYDLGLEVIRPLWGRDTRQVIDDFIHAGFEALVVTCKSALMGEEWLGRRIDHSFVEDLARLDGVDPSGEFGEYHTFVAGGPLFQRGIVIDRSQKVLKGERWLLDILEYH